MRYTLPPVILMLISINIINCNLFAQKSRKDSLLFELKKAKTDTLKVDKLNELALFLTRSFPDSALLYANKAESISTKLNDKYRLAESYKNVGNIYNGKDNFSTANNYYQQSLEIYKELGNTLGLAKIYNNLGALNNTQGDFIRSLECYQKSLELRKQIGDKSGMGKTYNNIGSIHYAQGNLNLALEYYQKSLEIRKEYNDKLGTAGCFNNIGKVYIDKEDYELAIHYFQESLKIYEEFEDKQGIAQCYKNIGTTYDKTKNYTLAIDYYIRSFKIDSELGDKVGMIQSLTNISKAYNLGNNFEFAKNYAEKSLSIAKEIGSKIEEKNAYEQLSIAYEGLGDLKRALSNHKLFLISKDSLFSVEKSKELELIESRYQVETKQLQIENLETDNKIKIMQLEKMKILQLFSCILLIIFIAFIIELLFIRKKLKKKNSTIFEQNEEILAQKEELENHRNHLEKLVTERTKDLELAKEKAEESDRLKSSFLTNMSHEIRTPMNAIIGFSSLLIEDNIDPITRINLSSEISKNGFLLLNLIDNILDLARIETKQLKIDLVKFNLNDLLNEIYFNYYEIITNKKIKFYLKLKDTNDQMLFSDPLRIKQILKNLIENAIKFTEHGFIEIGYSFQDEKLTLYVKDTGIGMDEKQLSLIFARFSKIENEKQKLYRGAGLGLSICKQLTELLQGEIGVESEPEKGTTFYIKLPINEYESLKSSVIKTNKFRSRFNWSDKTILIAEDDESNFLYFNKLLSETNIKIIQAKNGIEAVEKFKENNPDLILMDIKMPKMDGLEATRLIRQTNPNIPIIAQTAFSLGCDEKLSKIAGCNEYIEKPINKYYFFSLLHKFLT